MDRNLSDYKRRARQLGRELGTPEFYQRFAGELEMADEAFFDTALILRLREDIIPFLYDDFGLGIEHSKRVSIDAAALALAEVSPRDRAQARRLARLALVAGLLHDAVRLEDDHPQKGAELAHTLLAGYPLEPGDVDAVAAAVAAHEDLVTPDGMDENTAALADCLHDADLLRWGPDFFVTALWETMDYEDMSNSDIIDSIPAAAEQLEGLKTAFRTATGQAYGPQVLATGQRLAGLILPELEALRVSPDLNDFKG